MKPDEFITYQLPGITEFFWVSGDDGRTWSRRDRVWKKISYDAWKRRRWVTGIVNGVLAEWAVIAFVILIVILIAVGISKG